MGSIESPGSQQAPNQANLNTINTNNSVTPAPPSIDNNVQNLASPVSTATPNASLQTTPSPQSDSTTVASGGPDSQHPPNVNDAVNNVWNGIAHPEKDKNPQEVAQIAKNAGVEAAKGFVTEGLHGAIAEGLKTLGVEGGKWMGEKFIDDLKENKLAPKLTANVEAGVRDSIADRANVDRASHPNPYFDPNGGIYKASLDIGNRMLDSLPKPGLDNLINVMNDPGSRMNFDRMIGERISAEVNARASQNLK